MKENERHRLDQLLDLLAAEVAERLERRTGTEATADKATVDSEPEPKEATTASPSEAAEPVPRPVPEPDPDQDVQRQVGLEMEREGGPAGEPVEEEVEQGLEPPVASHTARFLGRLTVGLLVLVVLINIPINRHGTTLATAMPDNRALVIRDGLVVTEEDEPEIYVYQDGEFRWISSLDAFEFYGYTWEDVHVVEDGFLDDYPTGSPIHVLLKCEGSPHIYRVEGEEKRWIVDLEAFEAAGHVWEDVRFVPCEYLRDLPNGETIPPGQGPPPEP